MASIHEIGGSLPSQSREKREQEFTRKGVIMVLANRDLETQEASVFVVQHNANLKKGIRDNDVGLPSETIEPGEQPLQAIRRLLVEEIGISPDEINAFIQRGHEHLELKVPKHGIQADIVVLWLTDTTQLNGAHPKDTAEIKAGFFVPVDRLFPDSKLLLRQDLNPDWFLEPLIEQDFLSPNGGYYPANLNNIAPLQHQQI